MAEFLTAKACTAKIEEMVREAGEKIWLISPYIDIDEQLKQRLRARARAGIEMRLVYRGKKLPEGESEWLNSIDSLEIRSHANLHAKCYMNEREALITSLNLYEYSQVNNVEWGILVSRFGDEELYEQIRKEAVHVFQNSVVEKKPVKRPQPTTARTPSSAPADDVIGARIPDSPGAWGNAPADDIIEFAEGVFFENDRSAPADDVIVYHADETTARTPSAPPAQTKTAKRPRKRTADRKPSLPKTGVCVRDSAAIDFDILKPYCDKCFRSWNRYKNREYKEEWCHACGRDWTTDMDRPLCLDCLQRYRGLLVEQGHGREHPGNGVCIRDAEPIEFDLSKPYCGKCFRSWNRYKNREYQESACHMCGCYGPSTMDRPICADCYLNVEHIAFTQALGSDYALWVSWDDDM